MSRRASDNAEGLNLGELFKALVARRRWIAAPTFAALALSLLYVETATPRYTAAAKVLIENQESYLTRPDKAAADAQPPVDAETVLSEVETLNTADVARKLADRLSLADVAEFNPPPGVFSALSNKVFGAREPGRSDARLLENVLARMSVFAQNKSHVIQIEFSSRDPELAVKGADALASIFLENQEKAKADDARAASDWLAHKIEDLRVKVADTGAKVEAFRSKAGLLKGASDATVPGQQLSEINARLAAARAAEAEANARAQSLLGLIMSGRIDEVPDAAKDDSLRRFIEQRVALKAQIASESKTLLPQHPRMRELSAQLDGLDEEIRAAAERAARGFENDARLAGAQVAELGATLDAQSRALASLNENGVTLQGLELDAKAAREQLESYVEKYREASAREAGGVGTPDARIIASAATPRLPTFPQKLPIVALSTLAAFALSCAGAVTQALLRQPALVGPGIGDRRRSARAPDSAPVAASVRSENASEADVTALAERLTRAAGVGAPVVVAVAGSGGARAVLTALALARKTATSRRSVLIEVGESQAWFADASDRRRTPRGGADPGLAELCAGMAGFSTVLRPDVSGPLDLIARGQGAIDLARFKDVLEALAGTYECVFVAASDYRTAECAAALERAAVAVLAGSAEDVASARVSLAGGLAREGVALASLVTNEDARAPAFAAA